MLSYQHMYHAGNFADVHKHSLLIALLARLTQQDAPLHVLDTHAGRGFYDLSSTAAAKTGEHAFGATPLWITRSKQSGLVARYLDVVARYNKSSGPIRRYPGSARITRDLLRPGDQLFAAERHPGEFEQLAYDFKGDDPVTTELFHDDGLRGLAEVTPPPGACGLVVIDPSYEVKSEYSAIVQDLSRHWQGWPNTCAVVWYPLLPAGGHKVLLAALATLGFSNALVSEVLLHSAPKPGYRMQGSGIVLINSPWNTEEVHAYGNEIARALTATKTCGQITARTFTPATQPLEA